MTPLERIAEAEDMTTEEVAAFLKPFGIDLATERTVQRHPLRLTRIYFSGMKNSDDESGPFSFEHTFTSPCTSIASEKNLTGKTSVIAIAKWALRGVADDDVSSNVREWLEDVVVEGVVDQLPFAIEFDARSTSGRLVVGDRSAAAVTEFANQAQFTATMESFFDERLQLPGIPSFMKDDLAGKEVSHGWKAYLGTIWISDANKDLLLGETAFASLPARLLNMFVAVPFAEASYALGQAVSSSEATARLLAIDPNAEARAARAAEIESEIDNLRQRVDSAPDPVKTSNDVKLSTNDWRDRDRDLVVTERRLLSITEEHNDAAGELQLLRREAAAGKVLSVLEPSRCPRCTSPVEPQVDAPGEHCYVCTHPEPSPPPAADDPIEPLTVEVKRLAEAMRDLQAEVASLRTLRDDAATAMTTAQSALEELSDEGISDLVKIARLEGELASMTRDFGDHSEADAAAEQVRLLKAIRKVVEASRKEQAIDRFREIDAVLLALLKRLGFRNAAKAHLLANGGLEITFTSGVKSPFKRLQDGEKARARLATIVAMLTVGGGRHPGLIVYDSLADKEMNDTDLAAILAALAEMADEHDVQVIVTHKGHEVAINALGAESVIGPSSDAGHIF